jgi:SAM-dependent methyltransferase
MSPAQPRLACPLCHTLLEPNGRDQFRCPKDRRVYSQQAGVWRCLLPERGIYFAQFLREYNAVRAAEGRGSSESEYYRALPFADLSGRYSADWRMRARSYTTFIQRVLVLFEKQHPTAMKVLDLGAGNGWLSNRLARRGHTPAALDLRTGDRDGLGAIRHFNLPILAVQGEFDCLPFPDGEFDLVVFNASFHYATDYTITLRESLRVLDRDGRLAILDTPFYRRADSGQAMVLERQAQFLQKYGFPSNALASENFLTPERLKELQHDLHLDWQTIQPFFGLSWLLKPWIARLRGRREPANFPILIGRRP